MSKKDIVKYIIDEYGVTSPTDITNALKELHILLGDFSTYGVFCLPESKYNPILLN